MHFRRSRRSVHYGLVHRDAGDYRPSGVCSSRSDSDMAADGCDTQYDVLVHGDSSDWSTLRNTGDVVHETRPGVEMVIRCLCVDCEFLYRGYRWTCYVSDGVQSFPVAPILGACIAVKLPVT